MLNVFWFGKVVLVFEVRASNETYKDDGPDEGEIECVVGNVLQEFAFFKEPAV